jgi:chaperonin GroES
MTDRLTEITPVDEDDLKKLKKLFNPLNDVVIVALDSTESKTPGGILLPESSLQQMTAQSGTIVATGEGARSPVTGDRVPLSIKVGDRVIFGQYAGSDLQYGDLKLKAMREPDCLTRVSDESALQPKSVQLAKKGRKKAAKPA